MSDVYLLDTNVISDLTDETRTGHASLNARFASVQDQVLLPSMAVGEIRFGFAKAPNLRPDKRATINTFIARFDQVPFDKDCVEPYAIVRAELFKMHGTPDGKRSKFIEKHPEDLAEKITGKELGIDEPDLIIASIAMAMNLILVTSDAKLGMNRVKEAAENVFHDGKFPVRLRIENWSSA
ncbi:MAG: type II toxin-antitoxin system VapC family toxin [Candidatus Methylacidiphilales bacterium]|nr:type II toxin-antitoxin system VapC family toxin [Candidatus Methylacidiphilales bacterium]